ncbi:MAG: flagellar biosynthetic protein FliQ [Chloroflexi bacterium]|nr:MAG: flagellar biosynthetic protein FliQ [Chloroflexota bacterium]MBL1194814.1 flagellar biosynthetic protein FliQ [Chloroflexota bacterium]NOH12105.1 flagellar biosynthesis protein FliQ [Chloroflexota bacterium]
MTESYVLGLAQEVLMVTLTLAAPILLVSLLIGSLVSLFQAATQINETTLTFVPKIIGIALVLIVLGSWMAQQLISFTVNIFDGLPGLVQ